MSAAGTFTIASIPRPATAGDAYEQHLSRRRPDVAVRRDTILVAGLPLAAIALSLLAGRPRLEELFAGPPATAWIGLLTLVLLEGLLGLLVAWGLIALRQHRETAFFAVARDLTRYTVLQGRRDAAFLAALRRLRPGSFTRSGSAGLPRRFTMAADADGVMLLGRGTRPRVVAAFHWLHVPEIRAVGPDGRDTATAPENVVFVVSQDGADVRLGFELERAKVAWTERSFVEERPVAAVIASMQGHRHVNAIRPASRLHTGRAAGPDDVEDARRRIELLRRDADVVGTDYEREALVYESRAGTRLEPASAAKVRARRNALVRSVVLWTLGCIAGPGVLSLFV